MKQATGTGPAEVQANFDHLVEPGGGLLPEQPGPSTAEGNSKPPKAVRPRPHVFAAVVPSRKPAELRRLLKRRAHGTECHVEALTLGDEVLWDYERYEIAIGVGPGSPANSGPGRRPEGATLLGCAARGPDQRRDQGADRGGPLRMGGFRAPKKITEGVTFHGKRWTNEKWQIWPKSAPLPAARQRRCASLVWGPECWRGSWKKNAHCAWSLRKRCVT